MRQQQNPTPTRKEKYQHPNDELIPIRRSGHRLKKDAATGSRSQLDPDGTRDAFALSSDVHRDPSARHNNDTRTPLSMHISSGVSHASSGADWERLSVDESREGPVGVVAQHRQPYQSSSRERSRRQSSGVGRGRDGHRESSKPRDGARRESDKQTAATEYDNVIVSKLQLEREKLKLQPKPKKHRSPSKSNTVRKDNRRSTRHVPKVTVEPSDEASMASSIDNSSGVLDLDLDFDMNVKAVNPSVFHYRQKNNKAPNPKDVRVVTIEEDDSGVMSVEPDTIKDNNRRSAHKYREYRSQAMGGDDRKKKDRSHSSGRDHGKRGHPAEGYMSPFDVSSASVPNHNNPWRESPNAEDFQSFMSGATSAASTHTSLRIKPLRWTEQETDNLLQQLEFFGDSSSKDSFRFPQRSVDKVVSSIQAVVEKEGLRRDDPSLQSLNKALHSIRLVDLDRLLRMLQENHDVGDMLQDRRVLLLCGPTGSGKTTTLHFLAGTTLEEVDEQGFFHLKPVSFKDPQVKDFETSCCRKRVTKTMQATTVELQGRGSGDDIGEKEEIVVCDTPGLGHVDSIEEEISNGLGMINELQRARSIHPVLLLSRETLGSRFGNLIQIINAMREQFVLESKVDLVALNYLFTKYEGKHRTRICKQISVLEKSPPTNIREEDRVIFKAFVKDIVKKTTPKANLALPTEETSERCLKDVWETVLDRDGKDLIVPFASKSSTQKLRLQLRLTVYDFSNLLAKGDYSLALHRLHQLLGLAKILPDARESAEKARQIGNHHVLMVSDLIKELIDEDDFVSALAQANELRKLDGEIEGVHDPLERTMKRLRKGLKRLIEEGSIIDGLQKLESLRALAVQLPQAKEFVQQGFDSILKRLLRTMESQDIESTMHQLEELSKVAQRLPEAKDCAWHALRALNDIFANVTDTYNFDELMALLHRLCAIARILPDAKECIQGGFESLRKKSIETFEAKKYSKFITQMLSLGKVTPLLPPQHKFTNRGRSLLSDTLVELLESKDYHCAVDILFGLQSLQEVHPETTECIQTGFEMLLLKAIQSINEDSYEQSIDEMLKLGPLLPSLPNTRAPMKHGIKYLVKNVKTTVTTLPFGKSAAFVEQLHAASHVFPEAQDAVELAVEDLLHQSTKMVSRTSYAEGLQQLLQLGKICRKVLIPSQVVQRGIADLGDAVRDTVEVLDFESSLDFLNRLDKLSDMHPQVNKFVNTAFEMILQKAGGAMTVHDYSDALIQLEALGEVKHKYTLKEESVQRGIAEFSITLNKFLQYTDFKKAVDVLQQLFKVSRTFPETMQCVKLGYELLLEKAVDSYEQKRLTQAVGEIKSLGHLFHQFKLPDECNRGNLKYLATSVPRSMKESDFSDALAVLHELILLVRLMPEALECVRVGYDALLEKSINEMSGGTNKRLIQEMKQLAQAVEAVPEVANSRIQHLQHLQERILLSVGAMDFGTCKALLEDFNDLVPVYPEAEGIVFAAYRELQEKTCSAFQKNGGQKGLHHLQQLGHLAQFLQLNKRVVDAERGSDLINRQILESLKEQDFEHGRDLLEGLHKQLQMYPPAKGILQIGFNELQAKVAWAFDEHGYQKGINQMQQLLQLGMLLQLEPQSDNDKRGADLINKKVLEAMKRMDFEAAKELVNDMHSLVDLHSDATSLVVAAYKHLQEQTAFAFELSGCRKGMGFLQELANLRQHLDFDEGAIDSKGSDLINLKALEAMASLEFVAAVEVIEKMKKLLPLYPEGNDIVEVGFGELLERTAIAFGKQNEYNEGLSQLQQLGQLRQLLANDKLVNDKRGNDLLKMKILEASRNLKFETAVELTGRVNKIVHLYPEAEEIVVAGFKQLLKRTAMTFESSGYHQGISRLQQLGQLKQLLEMDERVLDDSKGNDLLKLKVLEKMKRLDYKSAMELMEMVSEIMHIYPDAIDIVQAGLGELLDKNATTFEKNGYREGIKQLQELGQLKQELEIDESALKDSRRHLVVELIGAARNNIESLTFDAALKFVQELNDVSKMYPEVKDGVETGFESLVQRVVATFEEHKCLEGSEQLQQLSELQHFLGLDDRALRGLENIVGAAQRTFEESDLQEATKLLAKLSKVADKFADARECVNVGVQMIWRRFEDAVDKHRFEKAADIIEEIGAFTKASPLADRYFRKGMKRLKKIADSTLDGEEFMVAVELSKRLAKIDKEPAEADDATGSDLIRTQMEKRIRQCDYPGAADFILKMLTELKISTPHASEYVRAGLRMIEQQLESSIAEKQHSDLLSVLVHFAPLERLIPETSICLDHAMQLLRKMYEKYVEKKEFKATLNLIEAVHDSSLEMQRAHECVQYGMCLLGKAIEKPLPAGKYEGMANLIHRLSKSPLPRTSDCARRGLKGFWKTTKHSIEEHHYADAISLMRHMRRLAPDLPEAGDCVQLAFVALRVRLVKAIDKDKYEMAMALLQQLSALAEELPEAFECAQFGFEALQERLEKTIDEENFTKIMDQMRFLGRVTDDLPEVEELFAAGFSALSTALSQKIDDDEFQQAAELMEKLCELSKEEEQPEAMDCTRQGLFKFWGKFEDQITEEDYSKAVNILQHLGALANALPEAEDGVQLGFEVLEEKFESMIEQKEYNAAVSLMQDLSKLAYQLPEASSCIQNGFEVLRERLVKIIEQQDYSTARNLISKLEQELPSIPTKDIEPTRKDATSPNVARAARNGFKVKKDVIQGSEDEDESTGTGSEKMQATADGGEAVETLRGRIIISLDDKRYHACLDAMVELSNMEQAVPAAGEALVFGCNLMKDHLEMSILKLNCTTVLEMMRVLELKTHRLPVAAECTRFGLQQLQKSVEKRVDQQEYSLAIELMDLLCKLSKEIAQATIYAQGALDEAIQYMVALREEAAASFEELAEMKDTVKFATMLDTTCENLENVMATEELRIYCSQLESNMAGLVKDPKTQITCGIRLAPSESFCSDQTRRLAEFISESFPELLAEPAYIDVLSGKEDVVVSALARLLLLRRVISNCPGSEFVDEALNEAMAKFYAFVDGVIFLAQSEFGSRMNLKSFETQIVLLTSLFNGLMKSKGSLRSDERKKLDDLEHRRARLMLRFEIEVADSLEVLGNQTFPHFTDHDREKLSAYVRSMKFSHVQKQRDVLLACINSRDLSSMVSSSVDVSSAERTLSSFDRGLEKCLDGLISHLEQQKQQIDAVPKTKAGLPATKEQLQALCKDVPKVLEEMEVISKWQTESYSLDAAYYLDRLRALDETVKELTDKVEEVNRIGFSSFLSSISTSLNVAAVSEYYSCIGNGNSS